MSVAFFSTNPASIKRLTDQDALLIWKMVADELSRRGVGGEWSLSLPDAYVARDEARLATAEMEKRYRSSEYSAAHLAVRVEDQSKAIDTLVAENGDLRNGLEAVLDLKALLAATTEQRASDAESLALKRQLQVEALEASLAKTREQVGALTRTLIALDISLLNPEK
jgi:uncharacterized protein (DUF3084 family)